jgi:hypothetical protein
MLVEAALVFMSFVLLTVGIMNFAQCLWILSTVSRATTLAARCAAVSQGLTDSSFPTQCSDYQQFAANAALPLGNVEFNVRQVANCGTQVSLQGAQLGAMLVTATVTYKFTILPYQLGPYTERACFTLQQ